MTDTGKKQRRRSFGALLSSSPFTSSSSASFCGYHDRASSDGNLLLSRLHNHPRPSHAHRQRSGSTSTFSSKLQKRSRRQSLLLDRSMTMPAAMAVDAAAAVSSVQYNHDNNDRRESLYYSNHIYSDDYAYHYHNNNNAAPSNGHHHYSQPETNLPQQTTLPLYPQQQQQRQQYSPHNNHHQLQLQQRHLRTKSGQKSLRSSVLDSFRSVGSVDDDQSTKARSKHSSSDEEDPFSAMGVWRNMLGFQVLHHGYVQMCGTGAMRRKKHQYLVLTDTHLMRFKNQAKAADAFPSIPAPYGSRSSGSSFGAAANRQSVVSLSSLADSQFGGVSGTGAGELGAEQIHLGNILAVHGLEEGKIEVCYLDKASKPAFLHIQVNDLEEFVLWLGGIRGAACKYNAIEPPVFDAATVDYVIAALVREQDYDPDEFRMFRVLHRVASSIKRTSSDDPTKNFPHEVCFLATGHHKLHVVPLPKPARSSVATSNDMDLGLCLGIMCMSAFTMPRGDDEIQMTFRVPLLQPFQVHLSSIFCTDIALYVWRRAEYLRPQWLFQPFVFTVPDHIQEQIPPSSRSNEDHGFFERTLTAYCASYDIKPSKIQYTIDYSCEDAPCFRLLPRVGSKNGSGYSALELISVFRALRYNETFNSVSFNGVKLDILQNLRDPYELDYDAMYTRAHFPLRIPDQEKLSILSREIRALALKSTTLRRMDFSFCLTKDPRLEGVDGNRGCGIPEAIFPLCRRQLTNVDWIVLNGLKLVDADLDYLVDAASQKGSRLRALEIAHCGISIHNLNLLLSTLSAQEETLEAINISGVQGRLSPELFQQQIGYFGHIRKINLSHVSAGSEPLIAPETLLNWRLEELCLSHMTLNEKTVASIGEYLASPQSKTLRILRLDQCGLTGRDVAMFLSHMTDEEGRARPIHLHASENRLHVEYAQIFDAIAQNKTPTHLTMRMVEFQKEEHFRQLVEALRKNTTLKYLDISKASLPYDAGPETCRALQHMFEENTTLEELDISGEYAHLEVARFGIGLNLALTGLKKNKTLKVLKIEYQKLGLQGANTMASVLEENNSLREVHCENNELNLQSFTVLVNGLQKNKSVTYLPTMDRDRSLSLDKVRREMLCAVPQAKDAKHMISSSWKVGSFRRTIQAATGRMRSSSGGTKLTKSHHQPPGSSSGVSHAALFGDGPSSSTTTASSSDGSADPANPEVVTVLRELNSMWDEQVARLQRYLYRNYKLLNDEDGDGVRPMHLVNSETSGTVEGWDAASDGRPATAASLGTMLQQMALTNNEGEVTSNSSNNDVAADNTCPTSDNNPHGKSTSDHNSSGPSSSLLTRFRSVSSISSARHSTKRQDPPQPIPLSTASRAIDISHELASPSPPPTAKPHFLREEDRGLSYASQTSTLESRHAMAVHPGLEPFPSKDDNRVETENGTGMAPPKLDLDLPDIKLW
ncbi:hypothetical protein VTO42DRAFT_719 [Malbranchea cinnamomea]